jgi:transcriptional regulator GlxA family with amidase domain
VYEALERTVKATELEIPVDNRAKWPSRGPIAASRALTASFLFVNLGQGNPRALSRGVEANDRMAKKTTFAILVYEDVEPIDIGATFGVFSMARRVVPEIRMFLVAERAGMVRCANGLKVEADYGYDNCPEADVLIVTGGPGWSRQVDNARTVAFVRGFAPRGTIASVCTGGMILAATGLLDGRTATTKREVIGDERSPLGLMKSRHPDIDVVEARLVDSGTIITGGGVSLAIDATLHLIERFYGEAAANETARIIEYRTAWRANKDAFKSIIPAQERRAS